MGNAASHPDRRSAARPAADELNRQIKERLRELHLEHTGAYMNAERPQYMEGAPSDEKNYVIVDADEALLPTYEDCNTPSSAAINHDVSLDTAISWQRSILSDPKNQLALSALSSNSLPSILTSNSAAVADTQIFNLRIPLEGSPITNQAASGRCWLFASTNVFRVALMKRHNIKSFQLSQAYLFFWDKLEKANYFLENVIETAGMDIDCRLLQHLLRSPVGDGGQWDMVANLVQKYGLVPHSIYPDSFHASNSAALGQTLTTFLRSAALSLRRLSGILNPRVSPHKRLQLLQIAKERELRNVYQILTLLLSPPPLPNKAFTWNYYTSDDKFATLTTTPLELASSLSASSSIRTLGGTDVHRLFSLVHDPRHDPHRLLTVDRLGNVWGGRPITYVNVTLPEMKDAIISMLRKGWPVFFGCDVGKLSNSQMGIMDTALIDYELGLGVDLGLSSKRDRLVTGESLMTHAMVLTAVHLEKKNKDGDKGCTVSSSSPSGQPVRWRVENSWSENAGDKGYFVMSDAWFDQFVYQAVVDPAVVSGKIRDVLKQKAKVLPAWDPMGALA